MPEENLSDTAPAPVKVVSNRQEAYEVTNRGGYKKRTIQYFNEHINSIP